MDVNSILAERSYTKQKLLQIDKLTLDNDSINQPIIYDEIGEWLVQLTGQRDSLEADLKELFAKKAIYYRELVKEPKLSDAKTEQLVLIDAEYKILNNKYLELCLKVNLMKKFQEALIEKTKSLDRLTDLYKHNYFVLNTGKSNEHVRNFNVNVIRKQVKEADSNDS